MNAHRRTTDRPHRTAIACMLAIAVASFILGRATHHTGNSVREIEASPVPSELPRGVSNFHDSTHGVTCWRVDGRDVLSCLPDQWLLAGRADDMQ